MALFTFGTKAEVSFSPDSFIEHPPCKDCVTLSICINKMCIDKYLIIEYLGGCSLMENYLVNLKSETRPQVYIELLKIYNKEHSFITAGEYHLWSISKTWCNDGVKSKM